MYDVIIIGGGPAGLMTAINCEDKKVLLIEKNNILGKKLLLTGGGRCNLTNSCSIEEFLNAISDKKFFEKTYKAFSNHDLINFFEKKDLSLKEECTKVFLKSEKSQEMVDFFLNEMSKNKNINFLTGTEVMAVKKDENDCFMVKTNRDTYISKNVVLATGGKSYPQTGSDGFGFEIAKKMGHNVTNLYSGEARIITNDEFPLAGISFDAVVSFRYKSEKGSVLFTHTGLSGEPILNLSASIDECLKKGEDAIIKIDFLPEISFSEASKFIDLNEKLFVKDLFKKDLPKRLHKFLLEKYFDVKVATMSRKERNLMLKILKSYDIRIKSVVDIEQAIVTAGGVSLKEVSPHTFESRKNKGIFFAGEVLNLHGKVGGFNLSIAFITGLLIARAIKKNGNDYNTFKVKIK